MLLDKDARSDFSVLLKCVHPPPSVNLPSLGCERGGGAGGTLFCAVVGAWLHLVLSTEWPADPFIHTVL